MKSGKYTMGTKEVVAEIKSSKVVIAAVSIGGSAGTQLKAEAEKHKVPVVVLDKNSGAARAGCSGGPTRSPPSRSRQRDRVRPSTAAGP